MIFKRLYDYALENRLLDDLAFVATPIPYVIEINEKGKIVQIYDRRQRETIPSKKPGGKAKEKLGRGKEIPCPKPHGNTALKGFACYFADTLARVLPVDDDHKAVASRETFWRQIHDAAKEFDDSAVAALDLLGQRVFTDPTVLDEVRDALSGITPEPKTTERCTFAFYKEPGATIVERKAVRDWYTAFLNTHREAASEGGRIGICQITRRITLLPTSHPTTFSLRGGLPQGVRLVSNDKQAFQSYGLDGAENASMSAEAAEGYARALIALLKDPHRSVSIGEVTFILWSKSGGDDFLRIIVDPHEQAIALLKSAHAGSSKRVAGGLEPDLFCLVLTANAARAVVRNYIELRLPQARENLIRWFDDLRIIDSYEEIPRSNFSIAQLVAATVRRDDGPAPDTATLLGRAALEGLPIPDRILAAALRRLEREGVDGFHVARMALIKLCLCRKEKSMTDELNPELNNPAYLCGRLLALLENIQYRALGKVNAGVVDRFFGAASRTPSLVFGPLLEKATSAHLPKLEDGLRHFFTNELATLTHKITAGHFPRTLSLEDQGRFALGYYHERADRMIAGKERKRELAVASAKSND